MNQYRLKDHTTIKIGGLPQKFYVVASERELAALIGELGNNFYLLGAGSNILAADCLRRPVIKLAGGFDYIRADAGGKIEVGAATLFRRVLAYCCEHNLQGVENLAMIPASIGGLIAMNASAFGRGIADSLVEVEVMDGFASSRRIFGQDIKFSYRTSSIKGNIILRAWLKLSEGKGLRERIVSIVNQRCRSQDFTRPSCGCIFKNPPDNFAGKLIDDCGLKGLRRNDAQVSEKHANFIVNLGQASYGDVDYLIGVIKDKVKQRTGILLEEEIIRWI